MECLIVPSALYEKQLIEWLEGQKDRMLEDKKKYNTDFFIAFFDGRIKQIDEVISHIKFTRDSANRKLISALNKKQFFNDKD